MNAQERETFRKWFSENFADAVMVAKGKEYAEGSGVEEDVNANFKLVAALLRDAPIDPLTITCTYMLKHISSICQYVRTRNKGSEPVYGRLGDARNYLDIMASLVHEYKLDDSGLTTELSAVPTSFDYEPVEDDVV